MEDENWELNEEDKEFDKWIFGSFTRYFLYLSMHYFLFIDYTGDLGGVPWRISKSLWVKIAFTFMIVV